MPELRGLHHFMTALIVQFKAFAETQDAGRHVKQHYGSFAAFFQGLETFVIRQNMYLEVQALMPNTLFLT